MRFSAQLQEHSHPVDTILRIRIAKIAVVSVHSNLARRIHRRVTVASTTMCDIVIDRVGETRVEQIEIGAVNGGAHALA